MVPYRVGAPLILVYFSGDWDVHWGYRILTHGHIGTSVESSDCSDVKHFLQRLRFHMARRGTKKKRCT